MSIYLGNQLLSGSTSASIPTGTILPYAGSTAPSGYLLCDGSAVSRTTYAALFAVIGTTYGEGDGNSTFNLPKILERELIDSKISVTVGYNIYSDGWSEQFGFATAASSSTIVITLPFAMKNTSYTVLTTRSNSTSAHIGGSAWGQEIFNKTTSSFTYWSDAATTNRTVQWLAKGFLNGNYTTKYKYIKI